MKFQHLAIASMVGCITLLGISPLTTSNSAWARPRENSGRFIEPPVDPPPTGGTGGLEEPSILICNKTDSPISYRLNRKDVPTLEVGKCWRHSNYEAPVRISFDASFEPGLQMTRYNLNEGSSYYFGINNTRSGVNLFRD